MDCFGEDYHTKFESRIYLEKLYGELNDPVKPELIEWHKEFMKSDHKGGKMLDIGSGPCIQLALLGSQVYDEITLTDYCESNRQELLKWINSDKDAFDWKQVLEFIGNLEDRDEKVIAERTRKAIKEVIPVNMVNDNIFYPDIRGSYDCVVSSLCLEGCYRDIESYRNGYKKIYGHVKKGGILVILAVLGEHAYCFGSHSFYSLTVNTEDVEIALKEAGFVIAYTKVIPLEKNNDFTGLSYESDALYFVSCRKL